MAGLAWAIDDNQLYVAFKEYESPFYRVATDGETGQSPGFGFVSFANQVGAEKSAAVSLNNMRNRIVRKEMGTWTLRKINWTSRCAASGSKEETQSGGGSADQRVIAEVNRQRDYMEQTCHTLKRTCGIRLSHRRTMSIY